ncbi:hypothetical protein [Ectothiorhodospira mobilis]|uniref:hypothetical protein n=1 Tax=Ectothiorhodospira mobilis TaxID=195064 RepID=UPI001EE80EDB|nr:hypothetical protein [Ectothiorhodospira mobilis]MCG5535565.1 hypothetical protein [Ectothiorhodospira mobilis]
MTRPRAAEAPASPGDEIPGLLDDVLRGLISGLEKWVDPAGVLQDPVTGGPSPPDHYGPLAAALALRLYQGPDSRWRDLLRVRVSTPDGQLDHAPFNRFLLLLLEEGIRADAPADEDLRCLRGQRRRCPLDRRYPSNNWTLLAGLCRALEAPPAAAPRAWSRCLAQLDAWLTPEGGFVDFPRRPGGKGAVATPIAYHHKALFIAVAAARASGQIAWEERVQRMLGWSLMTWDGQGHAGGLGRSTHALFGDACLVAALILLGMDRPESVGHPARALLLGILRRWRRQRRPDGLIHLNPAGEDTSGWDGYMYLSVYNAWTAALLAWARACRQGDREGIPRGGRSPGVPVPSGDARAGILRCGDPGGLLLLLSTRGQAPQSFGRRAAELRYAGGQPFHLTWQGRPLCPPPVRVAVAELLDHPALAGWISVLSVDGQLFGLTDWLQGAARRQGDSLQVTLHGVPRQLVNRPPEGLAGRGLAALDWRLLGGRMGRSAALRRSSLAGVEATLRVRMTLERPSLEWDLTLHLTGAGPVTLLNPCGHAFLESSPPERVSWRIQAGGRPLASGGWRGDRLPASLPGGMGRCLPPLTLNGPHWRLLLELVWPGADQSASRQASSSSR